MEESLVAMKVITPRREPNFILCELVPTFLIITPFENKYSSSPDGVSTIMLCFKVNSVCDIILVLMGMFV